MKIFKQIKPLKAYLKDLRATGKSIGLVPTMGALHHGHLALIHASKDENEVTVCSIFVNPTQFNNPADLIHYPRTIERDTELLQEVRCDILFCPDTEELYPAKSNLKFDFGDLDKVMEGKFRPGHFSGVGLVVGKLLHIVEPDHAYFGQKDWQQFAVIQRLAEELYFNTTLHSIATLREQDGLALSSRNLRLNEQQRKVAPVFFRALQIAQTALRNGTSIEDTKKIVTTEVEKENGVVLEYFEVADSENLTLLKSVKDSNRPILCIAGYVGDIRLIDNLFV